MAKKEKKKISGRSRPEERAEKRAPKPTPASKAEPAQSSVSVVDAGPGPQKLHSPWPPLVWLLIPLVACIVYGVATR